MGNAAIAKADVATTAKSVAGTATDTMVASDKPESMFGIGRPYLDKDPPHLAPIDGKEYAAHRRDESSTRGIGYEEGQPNQRSR
jgi:hypothetical protein